MDKSVVTKEMLVELNKQLGGSEESPAAIKRYLYLVA